MSEEDDIIYYKKGPKLTGIIREGSVEVKNTATGETLWGIEAPNWVSKRLIPSVTAGHVCDHCIVLHTTDIVIKITDQCVTHTYAVGDCRHVAFDADGVKFGILTKDRDMKTIEFETGKSFVHGKCSEGFYMLGVIGDDALVSDDHVAYSIPPRR